jgi:hypothetical protein
MDVAVLLLFALVLTAATAARHDLSLNVAASCGVAALHGRPRGRALAGSGSAATTAGAVMACSPESDRSQSLGALPGYGSGSGGQVNGFGGNANRRAGVGTTAGGAGSALAVYSLLVCVISGASLVRGRPARSAIGPQEG